jgi:alkylation response protein AidB-like acyl-CoA dehydrogenase
MTEIDSGRAALRTAVRELLTDRCSEAQVRAAVGDRGGVDEALWALVTEMGVLELAGGTFRAQAGASYLDLVVVFEEFGRFLAPIPALSSAVAINAFDGAADEDLRIWSDDIVSGKRRVAVALSVGEDLTTPAASVRVEDGPAGGLLINGRLNAVPDAGGADGLLVLAMRDGAPGLFFVLAEDAQVIVTSVDPLDLTRPVADVALASAPAVAVRGGGDLDEVLRLAWLLLAAEQVGVAQRALDAAVSYAKLRTQFGRTIGSFQAIKHSCVDMLVQVEGGRELVRSAAAAMDGDDPHEASLNVSLAAAYAAEAAVDCAQRCLQIYGGIGFTWEQGVHLGLRKAKADSVRLGDAGAHWQAVTAELARRAALGSD